MLIHNGTVIQSSFSLVEDGNVVKTFNVTAKPDDPLHIKVLNDENFLNALKCLLEIKDKLERENA